MNRRGEIPYVDFGRAASFGGLLIPLGQPILRYVLGLLRSHCYSYPSGDFSERAYPH